MNIACLGWGSLVWDPRDLPVRRDWFADGPLLPVEFLRCSKNGRMTLVLDEKANTLRVLWALMASTELDEAIEALRKREGTTKEYIGYWSVTKNTSGPFTKAIEIWAKQREIDAVVWTALGFKHPDPKKSERPTQTEVVDHFLGLPCEKLRLAKEYVRRAPTQIDTDYRRFIEKELGWTPILLQHNDVNKVSH